MSFKQPDPKWMTLGDEPDRDDYYRDPEAWCEDGFYEPDEDEE